MFLCEQVFRHGRNPQRAKKRRQGEQTCFLNPGKPCLQVKINRHHTNREPSDESVASHSFGICKDTTGAKPLAPQIHSNVGEHINPQTSAETQLSQCTEKHQK